MKKALLIFSIIALTLFSCNNDCSCTEKACPCPELTLRILAHVDDNTDSTYSQDEANHFRLIRTNLQYVLIDSIEFEFEDITGNDDYNKVFLVNQKTFSGFEDFRKYNLLVKNTVLNSTDTISSIQYNQTMKSIHCNECTNCDDEYVNCMQYSAQQLKHNLSKQDDFDVLLKK